MSIRIETQDREWTHLRQVIVDGEAVSWLWVPEHRIRLCGEPVRMAGIGGVETKPAHRMKGYARRLLSDTVDYMTAEGYDVTMLFGIPDFYDKFGYAPCIPAHHVSLTTREAERAKEHAGGYSARPMTEDDYGYVVKVSNAANVDRAPSLIRDRARFRGFGHGSDWHRRSEALVVEDRKGRTAGYFVRDRGVTEVKAIEVEATDAGAYAAVLHELAKQAVELRCSEVEMVLAADHPFAVFARRYGCRCTTRYARMGGGMMRILNQDGLFERMRPGMERRLARGELAGRRVSVRFETDLGTTRVVLNPKGKSESRVTLKVRQDRLMQLVVGYRTAADLLAADGVESRGPAAQVLAELFEGPLPYVLKADEF
jgi:predicted acetyltransferase